MVNPVILIVLDGWGESSRRKGNAIAQARTPNIDRLRKEYPTCLLRTHGPEIGLPEAQMGGSEVGHMHLGAGRTVPQSILRINRAIRDGSFFKNNVLLEAMAHVRKHNSDLHLLGLLSDGGIHSHIRHLYALLDMARREGVRSVLVHAILDGRDTPPRSAEKYLRELQRRMHKAGVGEIVSVIGRYFAMDRDNRWGREHKAYDLIVNCKGRRFDDPFEAIREIYRLGETDEFVRPTITTARPSHDIAVNEDDSVIFFNFRSDRARELSRAFVKGHFQRFRRVMIRDLDFVCLTQYDENIRAPAAFPPERVPDTFGHVISRMGLRQLRAAETEKFAHVTFFFSGGHGRPLPGEGRILVPSPRVSTYDQKPEMSAPEVTERVISSLKTQKYHAVILNYANADMVGHTGDIKAAVKAVETVDDCVGKVVDTALAEGYIPVVTADHGNAEEMVDQSNKVETSHSLNPVACTVVSGEVSGLRGGNLANVAPTLLQLMGVKKPAAMDKASLIRNNA